MSTSVRTKVQKKQPTLSQNAKPVPPSRHLAALEQALMSLEGVCVRILDARFGGGDIDRLTWQQRFKNIVTPVSLALVEYKGPRRFHYHYRHREDDDSILHPVLEPAPIDLLAQVCAHALSECQGKLVGIRDGDIVKYERLLETALSTFLSRYRQYKLKA